MRVYRYLAVTVLVLAGCQGNRYRDEASAAAPERSFNHDTVQTYDIQTGQFQQRPPFGARSLGQ